MKFILLFTLFQICNGVRVLYIENRTVTELLAPTIVPNDYDLR